MSFTVFFNWSTVALQFCVSFCTTMKRIRAGVHMCPLHSGPPSPPSHPQVIPEHRPEVPELSSTFPLALYFTHGCVYMAALQNILFNNQWPVYSEQY